jgi:hypothetical protein
VSRESWADNLSCIFRFPKTVRLVFLNKYISPYRNISHNTAWLSSKKSLKNFSKIYRRPESAQKALPSLQPFDETLLLFYHFSTFFARVLPKSTV